MTMTPLAVARAYLQAWRTHDFAALETYVSERLQVEVPINHYAGKADFLDAVRATAQITSDVVVLSELGGDGEAMLLYDITLPIGPLRVAEHFTVVGGKIEGIRQIHDTAALRAGGFERAR